jgi:hypothetical protein
MKKNAVFVSVWDGGAITKESPCVVDTDARTVEVADEDMYDGDDVDSLDEEYVLVNGEKFAVAIHEERGNYSAEEESRMFFYE